MKINLAKTINFLLFICLSLFFMNNDRINLLCYIYIIISFIIFGVNIKNKGKVSIFILCIGLLLIVLLPIIFILSDNGINNTLIVFVTLIISYLNFYDYNYNSVKQIDKIDRVINIIITLRLIFNFIMSLMNSNSLINGLVLSSSIDKNYTGVIIFLFFNWSLKRKNWCGVIICLMYSLIIQSRLLVIAIILMTILNLLFRIIEKSKFNIPRKFLNRLLDLKTFGIFNLTIIFTLIITIFSYVMVKFVNIDSISDYQESLNDKSNAIRVRANIYAIEDIKENPSLILIGYDNNIRNVLGVTDNSTFYLGLRLVQPHNYLLNFFLRYGIILSLIYNIVLCNILSKVWNRENLPFILTYLFMNMFMHSLLSTKYLVLFLYVLFIMHKNSNNNDKFSVGNEVF